MGMLDKFRSGEDDKSEKKNDGESIFNSSFDLKDDYQSFYAEIMRSSVFDFRNPILRQQADDNIVEVQRVATKLDDKDKNGNDQWVLTDHIVYDFNGKELRNTEPVLEGGETISFHAVLLKMGLFEAENQAREDSSPEEVIEKRKAIGDEYFVKSAYIENFVFDENFIPTKLEKGQIITKGIFIHLDLIEAEQIRNANEEDPKSVRNMEKGVALESFNKIAKSRTNLDDMLTKVVALQLMDKFVGHIELVEHSLKEFIDNSKSGIDATANSFKQSASAALEDADDILPKLAKEGVDTNPFEKFTAQVELYISLMYSKVMMDDLRQGNLNNASEKRDLIKDEVNNAEELFRKMGATDGDVDRLRGFVNSPEDLTVPKEISTFVERYKQKSSFVKNVMKKSPAKAKVQTVMSSVAGK